VTGGPDPFDGVAKALAGGSDTPAGDLPETKRKSAPKPKGDWVWPVPADAPDARTSHNHHGKPSASWAYRDAQGRLIHWVCRFDKPDGSKEILPQTLWRDGGRLAWRWGARLCPARSMGWIGLPWPQPRPCWWWKAKRRQTRRPHCSRLCRGVLVWRFQGGGQGRLAGTGRAPGGDPARCRYARARGRAGRAQAALAAGVEGPRLSSSPRCQPGGIVPMHSPWPYPCRSANLDRCRAGSRQRRQAGYASRLHPR
jgi:hypothetical protein